MVPSVHKILHSSWTPGIISGYFSAESALAIIVPAAREKDLTAVVSSLLNCMPPDTGAECILLINEAEGADESEMRINLQCFEECKAFLHRAPGGNIRFHLFYIHGIPESQAGVGYARKMAMDMASHGLSVYGNADSGIMVNLDADCMVNGSYLRAIVQFFNEHPKTELASIHFEHPLHEEHRDLIIKYELHLRFFINMQRNISLPFAYQTIGSSFAVRVIAYQRIGGMNKRKAGEDFYFIHKFTKKGTVRDLRYTAVYPSARVSDRVPFGTGRAMLVASETTGEIMTYNPESFEALRSFVTALDQLHLGRIGEVLNLAHPAVQHFMENQGIIAVTDRLLSNTTSFESFVKAFFQWFDAFKLMKYLHHTRDHFYPDLRVGEAVLAAAALFRIPQRVKSEKELLLFFRKIDVTTDYRGLSEVLALFPDHR